MKNPSRLAVLAMAVLGCTGLARAQSINAAGATFPEFVSSDRPLTDAEMADPALKVKPIYFPTVLGGIVPAYNLPGVTTQLKFTGEVLAGIFLGKINKWNDPKIVELNKGVKLPSDDIAVVHR